MSMKMKAVKTQDLKIKTSLISQALHMNPQFSKRGKSFNNLLSPIQICNKIKFKFLLPTTINLWLFIQFKNHQTACFRMALSKTNNKINS